MRFSCFKVLRQYPRNWCRQTASIDSLTCLIGSRNELVLPSILFPYEVYQSISLFEKSREIFNEVHSRRICRLSNEREAIENICTNLSDMRSSIIANKNQLSIGIFPGEFLSHSQAEDAVVNRVNWIIKDLKCLQSIKWASSNDCCSVTFGRDLYSRIRAFGCPYSFRHHLLRHISFIEKNQHLLWGKGIPKLGQMSSLLIARPSDWAFLPARAWLVRTIAQLSSSSLKLCSGGNHKKVQMAFKISIMKLTLTTPFKSFYSGADLIKLTISDSFEYFWLLLDRLMMVVSSSATLALLFL